MLDENRQHPTLQPMNKLGSKKRAQILGLMVEGMSIRAISRTTGASKNTIVKLLRDAGQAFSAYQDKTIRGLTCKRLQLDEIWSFVYAKQVNAPKGMKEAGEAGDVWTWTAIDVDTKLIASWLVGDCTANTARIFCNDLASRVTGRVQVTTDGHYAYINAMEEAFGSDADYAMLVKVYGHPTGTERRYSAPECVGTEMEVIKGNPDTKHISTSVAERQNLTMRMSLRRFTRLTNTFSKKVENHVYALSIYFMHYNLVRIHQTLRVTPAMAAKVTDKFWSLADMVTVIEQWEAAKDIVAAK